MKVNRHSIRIVGRPPAVSEAQPDHGLLLRKAVRAHMGKDFAAAERLYRRVLNLCAAHPDALHYLGVLQHQRGHSKEAVELVRLSLRVNPRHADAHNNLGNIHKECGQLGDAEAGYRRALELAPAHPQALGNLAVVLEALGRPQEARRAYLSWLERYPGEARAQYLFGRFLCRHPRDRDDIEQAVERFREASRLDVDNLHALESLGMALYGLGRSTEATEVYRDWSSRDPDDPIPQHMLAACGVIDVPPRATDAYVRNLFDGFAASFDEQLLKNLGYRAPRMLIDALGEATAGQALDVLDAGCGTGLCGPLIRGRARRLVGVDLSPGMVEQARSRECYDELLVTELTAHLLASPGAYDLMLCADTLVYFGQLETVLSAAHASLRPDGLAAFTLEALDRPGERHALSPSGRYQHTRAYVERALAGAGFADVRIAAESLRKEAGEWVAGWVVLARRTSGAF